MSEVNCAAALGSRMSYGSVRAWGSLGYSLTCLAYYFCLNGTGASNAILSGNPAALPLPPAGAPAGIPQFADDFLRGLCG